MPLASHGKNTVGSPHVWGRLAVYPCEQLTLEWTVVSTEYSVTLSAAQPCLCDSRTCSLKDWQEHVEIIHGLSSQTVFPQMSFMVDHFIDRTIFRDEDNGDGWSCAESLVVGEQLGRKNSATHRGCEARGCISWHSGWGIWFSFCSGNSHQAWMQTCFLGIEESHSTGDTRVRIAFGTPRSKGIHVAQHRPLNSPARTTEPWILPYFKRRSLCVFVCVHACVCMLVMLLKKKKVRCRKLSRVTGIHVT